MTADRESGDRERLLARRRAAEAQERKRRLLAVDLALALLVAVLVLVLGPGLALVAIVAGVVVLGFAVSRWVGRRRRSRAEQPITRDDRSRDDRS